MATATAKRKSTKDRLKSSSTGKSDMSIKIMKADDLPNNLSFKYNCRSPSRSSRAYKEMIETLKHNGHSFMARNSGMVIANGKYILDGGHTYLALMDAAKEGIDISHVKVKVFEETGLSEAEMIERSHGLNTKVTPPLRGERDLKGDWDKIKAILDSKYENLFEFRPNTKPGAPYKVEHLVALLHMMCNEKGEKAYTSKGLLVRLFNPDKYARVMDLLNDGIELYSAIVKDLAKHTRVKNMAGVVPKKNLKLPNAEEVSTYVPEAYSYPIFSAFSALIDEKGEWKQDPKKLWNSHKEVLIKQLIADYREAGKSVAKTGRSKDTYKNQENTLLRAMV